jgi:hypothetical protein
MTGVKVHRPDLTATLDVDATLFFAALMTSVASNGFSAVSLSSPNISLKSRGLFDRDLSHFFFTSSQNRTVYLEAWGKLLVDALLGPIL